MTTITTKVGEIRSVVAASDSNTQVTKVVVGRPVRRVSSGAFITDNLGDVDASAKTEGSVLVYKSSTQKWTATNDLEDQNINGGSY